MRRGLHAAGLPGAGARPLGAVAAVGRVLGLLALLSLFAMLAPPEGAVSSPSTPGVGDAERASLVDACARQGRALDRLQEAIRKRQPEVYYRTMKALLTGSDPVREAVEKVRGRIVGDMALIQGRNMRMGLGKDPASWPPPDPDEWARHEKTLKRLRDVMKADIVLLRNLRARLESVADMTLRDRDTFVLNAANLERDLGLLRGCLEQVRQKVDEL